MNPKCVIKEKEESFTEHFFKALDGRLEQNLQNKYRFWIKVCGYVIEFRFPSKEHAELIERRLVGQICYEENNSDAVFQFWTADYASYIGEENAAKRFEYEDENGYLRSVANKSLLGVDLSNKMFYYCRHELNSDPYWEQLLFYRWARAADMMLIHGAVVGVNGKGALITAQGGGGKSTLSVSCMLAGMDFVADDYFLVNRHGALQAFPLYKIVKLHVDMAARIKPNLPVVWRDDSRNGKQTLDVSGCRICSMLPIHAIVLPRITENEQPEILETMQGEVMNEVIHSTLKQAGIFDYRKEARNMLLRFYGLPTYEMRLCKDLSKNVILLNRFIEKEM